MSSSWDEYVCGIKATSPHVIEEVAIWGRQPGCESRWAASPGMEDISKEEVQRLCGDRTTLLACGPTVNKMKCFVIRDNLDDDKEPALHMQTKPDSDGKWNFIVIAQTHKALICAKGIPGCKLQQILTQLTTWMKQLRDCGM